MHRAATGRMRRRVAALCGGGAVQGLQGGGRLCWAHREVVDPVHVQAAHHHCAAAPHSSGSVSRAGLESGGGETTALGR
jgi:hypothetical protein